MEAIDRTVTLKSVVITSDSIGNQKKTYTGKTVYATVDSVTGDEYFRAGQIGLTPEYRITVWTHEYSGERKVQIDTQVLNVYRSYSRPDGRTELYLTRKAVDNAEG